MTGDGSVNADGLDVSAAVAFAVVASVIVIVSAIASAIASVVFVIDTSAATSAVVVVALFFGRKGFPLFTDYLGPPFFVGMVPSLQI